MIYTCYEMMRDCRADRPEGWRYFITQYVPAIRRLLTRYGDAGQIDRVVAAIGRPDSSLFESREPAPERWFLAEMRQKVLAEFPASEAEVAIDLETVTAALEPLTVTEKQAVWLETMRYTPDEAGALLRMAPSTVEKIRGKAAELIRGQVDSWRRTLLADNGRVLGSAALAAAGGECLPPKAFLDVLDGRTTWPERDRMERHVSQCWHCVDHFCRMGEVVELLRGLAPLTDAEAGPFRKLLGIEAPRRTVWKRLVGGR